jgi:Transport and Golgi organisation 2
MCTVSWIHRPGGYQLLCNRDEKHSRLPAAGPAIHASGGARFVAPIDGNAGGTWVAANEFGLTLALLNGNPAVSSATSRGRLITGLAASASISDLRRRLSQIDLGAFSPFSMAVLEPGMPSSLFEWDRTHLTITNDAGHRMPLTSSSFDPDNVKLSRVRDFSERLRRAGHLEASLLFDFHRSHGPSIGRPSAYSTCMHRSDARTVSFSWIDVSTSQVRFFYSPDAPCQWAPGETVTLARKPADCAVPG